MRAWLGPLLCLLWVPPTGAMGTIEAMDVEVGQERLDVRFLFMHEGAEAARLRSHLDIELGDRDGAVGAAEVQAYIDRRSQGPTDEPSCHGAVAGWNIGGRAPDQLRSKDVQLTGAEGPVVSPYTVREVLSYSFRFSRATNTQFVQAIVGPLAHQDLQPCDPPSDSYVLEPGYEWVEAELHRPVLRVRFDPHLRVNEGSLEPAGLADLWRGAFEADTPDERQRLRNTAWSFSFGPSADAASRTSSPDVLPAGAAVPFAGLALLLIACLGWMRAPLGSAAPLGLAGGGFSRVDRARALDHPRRQEILAIVEDQPGCSLADLARRTGLAPATVAHHGRVLAANRLIVLREDGFRTRFFPIGTGAACPPYLLPLQQQILERIEATPGINQTALLDLTHGRRDLAAYHLRRLVHLGLVEAHRAGRWRNYYALPRPPPS